MRLGRREFRGLVDGVTTPACAGAVPVGVGAGDAAPAALEAAPSMPRADAGGAGATDGAAACDAGFQAVHDTNAQALYLDGSHGPLTGTITVEMIVAAETTELEFWHGHGGQLHR